MASPWGLGPTSMLRATRSVAVSITLTVEAPSLDTYTFRPSGVITRPCGPLGTGIVATRRPCAGSITATASSLNSPTYTFGAGAAAGPVVAPRPPSGRGRGGGPPRRPDQAPRPPHPQPHRQPGEPYPHVGPPGEELLPS